MKSHDIFMPNHNAYRVEMIMENAVRIRYSAGGIFKESLMERYELVNVPESDINTKYVTNDRWHSISNDEYTVEISLDSSFRIINSHGGTVIDCCMPFVPQDDNGVGGKINIKEDERFYGGGYRPNKNIELRGQIIKNWCASVTNNGPSPWIMSSNGWGIFWNNSCETFFDIGKRKSDELVFWSSEGDFDIILFFGSFKQMIEGYTTVTGKPSIMPLFGYGITWVNNEGENEISLMYKAERLRKEGIPSDTFSISCEWMSTYYDKSVNQEWTQNKYFIKPWMHEEQTFIHVLKKFGIKTTLWTPCAYDLTHEQERRYFAKHPEAKNKALYTESILKNNNSAMSIDNNSKLFRDEKLFPTVQFDPYTLPGEAWAEHFKKYFDLGVAGIAEDGHMVEITKIDKCYANGHTYKTMHNINQSLNSMQYHDIYREYTGNRIFVRTPSTFVGHQKYCGTWCGDTTSDRSYAV